MGFVDTLFSFFYQFMDSFAYLVLAALGLSIIFGMMGLINLAHGEYIMLGAYITTLLGQAGMWLPLAIACGTVGVGIFGGIIDRLFICRLYKRPLDSVVASWGISLLMSQTMLLIFGPTLTSLQTPMGSFTVGGGTFSTYRMFLPFFVFILLLGIYVIFKRTRFGLYARATMQNAEIAKALGVNSNRMYMTTYIVGSALAGLAGGLYAPTISVVPNLGNGFMVQAFVTVVVGGADPMSGTLLSGGALGLVNGSLSLLFNTFIGRVGLLLFTIIIIRVLPKGFSGLVEKIKLRRRKRI